MEAVGRKPVAPEKRDLFTGWDSCSDVAHCPGYFNDIMRFLEDEKKRRDSRVVWVGEVPVGGDHPIVVQSMTTTDTRNVEATVKQIISLQEAGCELIRVAVLDREAAQALASIKARIKIPLIADIHFDHRLALESIKAGCDGLRINPGNIGAKSKVQEVVKACRDKKIPIRIGVNAGSLDKKILARYKAPGPQAMVESAMENVKVLEDMGFYDIKISLKASSVALSVQAYRLMAEMVDYPLPWVLLKRYYSRSWSNQLWVWAFTE